MRLPTRTARIAAHLLAAVALATCTDAPSGPARPREAHVAFNPVFTDAAHAAAVELQAAGITVSSVRMIIYRPEPHEVLADHVVSVAAGDSAVTLTVSVAIRAAEEQLKAKLQFREASGVVLYEGSRLLTVRAGDNAPAEVPATAISYVGPGAGATTLTLAPVDTVISTATPLTLVATAKDSAGTLIASPLVLWSSSDTTLAKVSAAGIVTPGGGRGEVLITARIPNGVAGHARVGLTPPPAALLASAGAGQVGTVTSTLQQPFTVRVVGADQLGVAGVPVSFMASPGAAVTPATATTNVEGFASTMMTLGQVAGAYEFKATAGELAPVGIAAKAEPGAAAAVAVLSGNGQSALVGSVLAPLTVKVTDAFGNPVEGEGVTWAVVWGTGSLSSTSAITDSSGVAAVTYTLGTSAGTDTVRATITGAAAPPAEFTLTALPLPATQLLVVQQPPDTARSGIAFPNAVRVQLADSTGRAVAQEGVAITTTAHRIGESTAGVELSGSTTVSTTADGLAEFAGLALTGLEGPMQLRFAAPQLAGATSDSISLLHGTVASLLFMPAPPTTVTVTVGTQITADLWLETRDLAGNRVPWEPVRFVLRADSATGPVVMDTVIATNSVGELPSSQFPVPATAGTYIVDITVGTPVIARAGFTLVVEQAAALAPGAIIHGAATALEAGDRQVRLPGELLASPLRVQVLDAAGAPLANAGVVWRVAHGTAVTTLDTTITDASGLTSLLPALAADTALAAHVFEASPAAAPDLTLRFQAVARPDSTYDRVWFGVLGGSGVADWGGAANWDAGVPTTASSVLLPHWSSFATPPQLTSDVAITSLRTVGSGYGYLDLNGRALTLAGNVAAGQILGAGIVRLSGAAASAQLFASGARVEIPQGASIAPHPHVHAFALDVHGTLTVTDTQVVNLTGGDLTVGPTGALYLVGSGSIANARAVVLDDYSTGRTGTGSLSFSGSFEQRPASGIVFDPAFTVAGSFADSTTRTITVSTPAPTLGNVVLTGPEGVPASVSFTTPVTIAGQLQATRVLVQADSITVGGQAYADSTAGFGAVRVLHSTAAAAPAFAGTAPALVIQAVDASAWAPSRYQNLEVRGLLTLNRQPHVVQGALAVLGPAAAVVMSDSTERLTVHGRATWAGMNSAQTLQRGMITVYGDFVQQNTDQLSADAFRPGPELEVVFAGAAQNVRFDTPANPSSSGSYFSRVRVEPGAVLTQQSNVYVATRLDARGQWTSADYNSTAPALLLDMVSGSELRAEAPVQLSSLNVYQGTTVDIRDPGSVTARACYNGGASILGLPLTCETLSDVPLLGGVLAVLMGTSPTTSVALLATPADPRRGD